MRYQRRALSILTNIWEEEEEDKDDDGNIEKRTKSTVWENRHHLSIIMSDRHFTGIRIASVNMYFLGPEFPIRIVSKGTSKKKEIRPLPCDGRLAYM